MPLDAFTARLGIDSGRLERDGGTLFVLGSLSPGRVHDLEPGDYVEIAQRADLTLVDLVRVRATLRLPAMPSDRAWTLTIQVDGGARASIGGWAGRTREITDLAADVSVLRGEHEVAVRLALESI